MTLNEASIFAELTANVIVIIGAVPVFFWLKNRSFDKKTKEIRNNLRIKAQIKEKLREHVDSYDRTEPHDIGIRLVYWKNYPWKLEDDGYKQLLYYDTNLDKRLSHSTEYLTNTGVLVEEHIWFFSQTVYLGEYGIYLIDKTGIDIKGFKEIKQKVKLIRTLRYKYIINWDFETTIEYEPVFYTKYKYTKKKLFEDQFIVQNYDDDGISKNLYLREYLDKSNRVKNNKSIKYRYLLLKGKFKDWLRDRMAKNKKRK